MTVMFYEKVAAMAGLCVLGLVLLYLSRTRNVPLSRQLSWGRVWLRMFGWACLFVGGFFVGNVFLAGYSLVIILVVAAAVSGRTPSWGGQEIWVTIAAGIRHQLPIPSLVEAAVEESGQAARYRQLLARLRAGMPLEELVRRLRIGRPERTALALATKTGRFDEAIEKAREYRSAMWDVEELFTGRMLLLLLLLQGVPAGAFMFARISGHFGLILKDFGLDAQTAATRFGLGVPAWFFSPGLLTYLWTAVSFGIVVGILLYWLGGRGILADFWPWSRCSLQSRSLILMTLGQGVRSGLSFTEIFDVLVNHPPTLGIRGRLLRTLEAMFRGDDPWDAMRKSGILSPADKDLLAASQQLGELPLSLETLARLHRDRYSAALRWWAVIGYLAIVTLFVLGAMIAYACCLGTLLAINFCLM